MVENDELVALAAFGGDISAFQRDAVVGGITTSVQPVIP
jgi:hypothetical protein